MTGRKRGPSSGLRLFPRDQLALDFLERNRGDQPQNADHHDAYRVARWLSLADHHDTLTGFLNPALPLSERIVAEVEG